MSTKNGHQDIKDFMIQLSSSNSNNVLRPSPCKSGLSSENSPIKFSNEGIPNKPSLSLDRM